MPDPLMETLSATQSAALFDVSPYTTRWLLWRVFSGLDEMESLDAEENERMLWGNLHEPTVFKEAMRRLDLEGEYNEAQEYVRHPEHPIGCTPDGKVFHPSKGKAVVQVKCVDWMIWKDTWTEDLPPPQICHQVQHEMQVMDAQWAVIPTLINGNELRLYEMYPDAELQSEILKRANEFFIDVKEGNEPDPLGVPMEQPTLLKREYKPAETTDLTASEEAYDAIQALRHWTPLVSGGNKAIKNAKAKLIALSGGAGRIKAHGYGCEIKQSETKETAIELPKELRSELRDLSAYIEAEDIPGFDGTEADRVIEAANFRKVTRKAGVTTRFDTWEAPTEETPGWLQPFEDMTGAG